MYAPALFYRKNERSLPPIDKTENQQKWLLYVWYTYKIASNRQSQVAERVFSQLFTSAITTRNCCCRGCCIWLHPHVALGLHKWATPARSLIWHGFVFPKVLRTLVYMNKSIFLSFETCSLEGKIIKYRDKEVFGKIRRSHKSLIWSHLSSMNL